MQNAISGNIEKRRTNGETEREAQQINQITIALHESNNNNSNYNQKRKRREKRGENLIRQHCRLGGLILYIHFIEIRLLYIFILQTHAQMRTIVIGIL